MNTLKDYLQGIKEEEHANQLAKLIMWVHESFPQLSLRIAWNQPMFTDHETYIVGFSASTKHFSIAPEKKVLDIFLEKIEASHYSYGKNLFRIKWNDTVDYDLLKEIIKYSIEEKKDCKTFWLKS